MKRKIYITRQLASILLSFLIFWSIVGCTRFVVNVDSIKGQSAPIGATYCLLSGMEGVSSSDLQFREFSQYVNRALSKKGYIQTDNIKEAKLAVFLLYGIGPPKTTYYSFPIYGQTGGGSSSFTAIGPGGLITGTIDTQPSYGVVGTGLESVTTYFRFIILEATDFNKYETTGRIVPLWKTTITSEGTSGDLRRVFPVLVGAATDYIGTHTSKQVSISLTENDDRVKYIKEVKGYVDEDYKINLKDMGSEKKKTSIYSFEEIKEWHNKVKDRGWRKISESEDITYCYDSRNIIYPSKSIVRVFTLETFESKKAINDKINHYRQLGLSTKGYENLYGTLTLQEINCNSKMYLPIYFMDYDKTRNSLNQSHDLSSNGWSEISSTMPTLEKLYKVVCPGGK